MKMEQVILLLIASGFVILGLVNEVTMDREELSEEYMTKADDCCSSEAPPFGIIFRLVTFPLLSIIGVTLCVTLHIYYRS